MRVKETSFMSNSSQYLLDATDLEDESSNIILHVNLKNWDNMSFSTDPDYVLENYKSCLSELEANEILSYNHIYCIADKKNKLSTDNEEDYQDENGMYILIPGDQLKYRYEIIQVLGKGSYAQVIKAYDHKLHTEVAIKLINQRHFDVAASEAKILEYIKQHDGCRQNIVELQKRFFYRGFACFVFELAKCNLFDFVQEQGQLPTNLIRKFTIQLLQGLNFLSHHGIIHCDIKAENILVFEDKDHELNVKIADFGLACFESDELYPEVQSLWCRAPEVLLEIEYTTQIDMWSLGCILAFMSNGRYAFRGEGSIDQLCAIMEVVGLPSKKLLEYSSNKENWFDEAGYLKNLRLKRNRVPNSISLENILGRADRQFVAFVKQIFKYNPDERLTPRAALNHEWILEGMADLQQEEDFLPSESLDERDDNMIKVPFKTKFISSSRNLFKLVA